MERKPNKKLLCTGLIVSLFVSITMMNVIYAQAATIYVNPAILEVQPPGTFEIDVVIADVIDLYYFEFKLFWDNSLMEATTYMVQPPPEWDGHYSIAGCIMDNHYNATHGMLWLAVAAREPAPSFNGTHSFIHIAFRCLRVGESVLDLSETVLLDSNINEICHEAVNGYVIQPKMAPWGPIAVFTQAPTTAYVDEIVTFNASGSLLGWTGSEVAPIVEYAWDFETDDIIDNYGVLVTHTYTVEGNYTVTLKVTDSQGLWNTTSHIATVLPKPPLLPGIYAGTTNPGVVYRYISDTMWEAISPPLGFSVTSLIEYEGRLYAAAITDPYVGKSSGYVYRYEGDMTWTLIGRLDKQVTFLIAYNGELYAGTVGFFGPARLYRYVSETISWIKVLEYYYWIGFRSAYVWEDWLYLGDWTFDAFARWNGVTFDEFYPSNWGSCVYGFELYGDYLYAGCYEGSIYRLTYEPPTATLLWCPPGRRYAWALKEFRGTLHIGFDANGTRMAPLYTYDGAGFNQVWSYSTTTGNAHEGIISMATDPTYLYIGVGGEALGYPEYMSAEGTGRVYRTLDGTTFELISGDLGTGVQTLYYVPPKITVTKWFTDSKNNRLPTDAQGNPMVIAILYSIPKTREWMVAGTNPGQVLAWVNVTNIEIAEIKSITITETLPLNWEAFPSWDSGRGAIHVYFVSYGVTTEITDWTTIVSGSPGTVKVSIDDIATAVGKYMEPSDSILVSVKMQYSLEDTMQSPLTYPTTYANHVEIEAYKEPNYRGLVAKAETSALFIIYAKSGRL